jgi:UDP:flavonoid glycosyltransferase YjiC (YdhE family)
LTRRLRVLLAPFGSEGDVNPLVWLGRGLKERGHEPVFLLTPHYAHRVAGMEWHPIGTEEDFLRLAGNPDLWKPVRGTLLVARAMIESLAEYRRVFRSLRRPIDVVVTSSFGLGAACLAERARIPHLMLHYQPICVRSVEDFPVMGPESRLLGAAPRLVRRLVFGMSDLLLDTLLLPGLNRFRSALNLDPWGNFYGDALLAGDGVGLLFPEWFGGPQSDWPAGLRQFGFPISPGNGGQPPDDLCEWFARGEAPVLWTHGSANLHVGRFQRIAIGASGKLGIRSLIVSRTAPKIDLPAGVFHCPHVPFESVFGKCRAVVHHGGIGTTAKAFAAGIPQIVMPLAHDQFDNAARIERVGAGLICGRSEAAAVRALQAVLVGRRFEAGVERVRGLSASGGDLGGLCSFVEEMAGLRQVAGVV